jgi:MscS family membrane protein
MVLQLIGQTPLLLMTVVRRVPSTKDRMKRNHRKAEMERTLASQKSCESYHQLGLARCAMSASPHHSSRSPFSLSKVNGLNAPAWAFALSVALLICLPASGQIDNHTSPPATSQPETPLDALGRTTPRGAVLGFLLAARSGDDELAARYLNTRLRGKAAADLAHQLFVVLDRRLPAKLHAISDKPEGSLSDPLRPDEELVGTISGGKGNVDITLERVNRGRGETGSIWLFSNKTLDSIPDLYEEVNVISVEEILPAFLMNRFAGVALYEWLIVLVGIPLFFLVAEMLNRLFGPLVGSWRRRLRKRPDLPDLAVLPIPIRFLLLAAVILWLLTKFNLPLLARQFWSSLASILAIAGCVWLVILVNGLLEKYVSRFLPWRNLSGATLMLRLVRRLADVLVVFVGLLVTLYHFGVNPTAALAGLGVGGIAVALAAQKTLENVIAGVSLIFDRAISVGDMVKVGDTQGTVDDIGFRSTRLRTLDRTVVSVPNGQIANLSLENFSVRDKFWIHPILSLRYSTTSPQMHVVLESIRKLLRENQSVEANSIRVRFLRFGSYSLDVEVFAYAKAHDWSQFLELQEDLLLGIMQCIESAGVQIALPSQSVFLASNSLETESETQGTISTHALSDKTIEPKAKSA